MKPIQKILLVLLVILSIGYFGISTFYSKDVAIPESVTSLDLSLTDGDYYIPEEQYTDIMLNTVEPYLEELRTSGYFTANDGANIYYEQFLQEDAKASVVILHGFTESIDKYAETIYYFLDQNYSVSILEQRGHGRSERAVDDPSMVYVKSFNDYVTDLECFISQVVKVNSPNDKLFLYAHSMGGGIGAAFLETYPDYFSAAALSAPMLTINSGSTPLWAANILCNAATLLGFDDTYILNHGPYTSEFNFAESNTTSRVRFDYINTKREANAYFKTNGASYAWLNACLDGLRETLKEENCAKINIPTLVFQAADDAMVLPGGQHQFVNQVGSATLIKVPNSKHELYSSPEDVAVPYFNTIFNLFDSQL